MKCPFCGSPESKVIDSRPADDDEKIRRRRECINCGKRFTTFEAIETIPLVVIKKDKTREPFSKDAQSILLDVANQRYEGCISAKQVADIYYLMHHFLHSDTDTRERLGQLFGIFTLLDTTAIDCQSALSSSVADYEDAILLETANRCNIDYIITRNKPDFKSNTVKIFTPQEFLNKYTD